jgi:hypothetical protein
VNGEQNMNAKKIMAIFMCMLVMALIPAAAGISDKQTPQSSNVGRTWIWGIICRYREANVHFSFRCIFVRFTTIGIGEHYSGGLHFLQLVNLKAGFFTGYHSAFVIVGNYRGELNP